jgi:hypothetical protein
LHEAQQNEILSHPERAVAYFLRVNEERWPLAREGFSANCWSFSAKSDLEILRYFSKFFRYRRGEVTGGVTKTSPTHLPPTSLNFATIGTEQRSVKICLIATASAS